MDRDFSSRISSPVKVGDEIDVKIEAVGEKGDGIAKKNGFVLFVPGTKEGDQVKIKVTRVLRRVGFAEVVGKSSAGASGEETEGGEEKPAEEKPSEEETKDYSEGTGEDTEDFGGDLEEQ